MRSRSALSLLACALVAGTLTRASAAPPSVTPGEVENTVLQAAADADSTGQRVSPYGSCALLNPALPDPPSPRQTGAAHPQPASPAAGAITLTRVNGCYTLKLEGVFDPYDYNYDCVRTDDMVDCRVLTGGFAWYCAAWALTAQSLGTPSEVAAQVSCNSQTGWSPTDLKTAHTAASYNGGAPTTANTGPVNWDVTFTITCGAFAANGLPPVGDYWITCNEPGIDPGRTVRD